MNTLSICLFTFIAPFQYSRLQLFSFYSTIFLYNHNLRSTCSRILTRLPKCEKFSPATIIEENRNMNDENGRWARFSYIPILQPQLDVWLVCLQKECNSASVQLKIFLNFLLHEPSSKRVPSVMRDSPAQFSITETHSKIGMTGKQRPGASGTQSARQTTLKASCANTNEFFTFVNTLSLLPIK